jgi:hypothetical protein
MVDACLDEDGVAFFHGHLRPLDGEDARAFEHDVDLVVFMRLLLVRLRRDEHIDTELEAGGLVDDLVTPARGAQLLDDRRDSERVHGQDATQTGKRRSNPSPDCSNVPPWSIAIRRAATMPSVPVTAGSTRRAPSSLTSTSIEPASPAATRSDEVEGGLSELGGCAAHDDGPLGIRRGDCELPCVSLPNERRRGSGRVVEGGTFGIFGWAYVVEECAQPSPHVECCVLDDAEAFRRRSGGICIREEEVDVPQDGEELVREIVTDVTCEAAERRQAGQRHELVLEGRPLLFR